MLLNYILTQPFLYTRVLLLFGGVIIMVVWNLIYDRGSLLKRIKTLNKRTLSYSLVQSILFYPQILGIRLLPIPDSPLTPFFNILGLCVYFLGIFIATWARITMKNAWGIPGSWDKKRDKKLIKEGPFKFSRNPIYLGIILIILGFELALNSYLFFLAILAYLYFSWEIRNEEKILEREFGQEYKKYKKTVPKFIGRS